MVYKCTILADDAEPVVTSVEAYSPGHAARKLVDDYFATFGKDEFTIEVQVFNRIEMWDVEVKPIVSFGGSRAIQETEGDK